MSFFKPWVSAVGVGVAAMGFAAPVTFLATDGAVLYRADSSGATFGTVTMNASVQSLTRLPSGFSLPGATAGDIIACARSATSGRYKLYRMVDPLGAASLVEIGSLNQGLGSLVFANGEMWGVEDSVSPIRMYKFDPTTGNSTGSFSTGVSASGCGGLAYHPGEGRFYFTDYTQHRLYRWTPGGSATVVGPVGFGFSNNGIEFHEGTLYGALRRDSPSGSMSLGRFDLSTGAFTVQATVTGVTGNGTGFLAVPEPGTMAALGLGVLALVRRKRRKA